MPAFILAMSPHRSTLHRNLYLDLSASVGLGTTMAVVAVLLPSLARLDGMGAMGLAMLASIPLMTSLLSLLAGRIGPTTIRGLAVLRAIGSATLLSVFFVPVPEVIVVATFAFWTSVTLGSPLQQRLWTDIYPSDRRGKLIGIVGTGRFAAGTVALLVCGFAIDGTLGMSIIAAVAVVGSISALAITRLATTHAEMTGRYTTKDSLRAVWCNPVLQRVTVAHFAFGAGLVAAPALIAVVQVDRLGLGLDEVAIAGLAGYLATAIGFNVWGRVANRIGGLRTVALGGWLGVVSLAMYAAAGDLHAIIVAAATMGAAGAAIDVSWAMILSEHAPQEDQAPASAGFTAIMGLRGLMAPYLIMLPVQLGLVDVTMGLLICAGVTTVGAILYGWAAGIIRLPALAVRRGALAGALGALVRL